MIDNINNYLENLTTKQKVWGMISAWVLGGAFAALLIYVFNIESWIVLVVSLAIMIYLRITK